MGVTVVKTALAINAVVTRAGANVVIVAPIAETSAALLAIGAYLDTSGKFQYFPDQVFVADASFHVVGKTLTDTFAQIDSPVKFVNLPKADTISLSESVLKTLEFIRAFNDTFEQSDANVKLFSKPTTDAFALTDFLTRSLTRTIQDGFAMNDSADLADGITYQTAKYINNLAFVSDAKVLASSFSKIDTVSLVSAGSLTSQGYADVAYFAEDYVGDSRTFS